jgi:hypothetical protein
VLTRPPPCGFDCGELSFSRSEALPVSWTGPSTTSAHVEVHAVSNGRATLASCSFATRPAVIPAAVMARLPAGATRFFMKFEPRTRAEIVSGEWKVDVVAGLGHGGGSYGLRD